MDKVPVVVLELKNDAELKDVDVITGVDVTNEVTDNEGTFDKEGLLVTDTLYVFSELMLALTVLDSQWLFVMLGELV
jgi:hypothetical protein